MYLNSSDGATLRSLPRRSENKLARLSSEVKDAYFRAYTARHLARVFPAGTRIDSSNYNPCSAWERGCQIVALNFQGAGVPMWVNQGESKCEWV